MNGAALLQFSMKSAMNWSDVIAFCVSRVEAIKSLRLRSSMSGWSSAKTPGRQRPASTRRTLGFPWPRVFLVAGQVAH